MALLAERKFWGRITTFGEGWETFFKHGFCSRESISPAFLRKFSESRPVSPFLRRFQNPRSLVRRGNLYPILRSRKIKSSELEEFTLPVVWLAPHPTMGALPPCPRLSIVLILQFLGGRSPQTPCFPKEEERFDSSEGLDFPSE